MSTTTEKHALGVLPQECGTAGIGFGADYNPEQWAPEIWAEDIRLMREAGITIVAINIFGWALIEPRSGRFDFTGLDAIVALLHEAGIGINLGTGTASPPPWLTTAHPEILPMAADGTRRWPGGRQAFCPSSPVFREHAVRLATALAERYGTHPAVQLWHVSNELGCHNALCYCDVSAQAFREWLQKRYGTLDALNAAWGTAFWSQRYGEWEEILPPRRTLSAGNPTQALDFSRFSSDEVLACYLMEERVIRRHSAVPVTTNFMVTAHIRTQNYWDWAPHVDIVANDHYLDHRIEEPHQELSFAADLTRGLAGGRPWMLMEQATGAVNWQPFNLAKAPGEMLRNSLTHVARGADSVCFFQWRASTQGTEKFHSGLVPHAGTRSRKWQEVLDLGRILDSLREVAGSTVVADVAILFSWESWWAVDRDSMPSEQVRYLEQVHAAYRALWNAGITTDVVRPGSDLSRYRLVVVPALYLVRDREADALTRYVADGGSAVITFFSGIADEDDRVRLGGYPGAFTEVLGLRADEFFPLESGRHVHLDDGAAATIWAERVELESESAEVVASFVDGPLAGGPAVTRNAFGDGTAWYVATALERPDLQRLLTRAAAEAGVTASGVEPGVEAGAASGAGAGADDGRGLERVVRRGAHADYVFLLNHSTDAVTRPERGFELTAGHDVDGLVVPPGGVAVVRVLHAPPSTGRQ